MTLRRTTVLLLLATLMATGLAAQNCTTANYTSSCSVTVNVSVAGTGMPKVYKMTLSADSTTLTPPAIGNYGPDSTATITNASAVTATIQTNQSYHVTLKANATTWTGPVATKPAGDLTWATSPGGPYTAISTTAATIYTGTLTNGQAITLSFRTKYNFIQNVPGTYSLTLTFTLVSP